MPLADTSSFFGLVSLYFNLITDTNLPDAPSLPSLAFQSDVAPPHLVTMTREGVNSLQSFQTHRETMETLERLLKGTSKKSNIKNVLLADIHQRVELIATVESRWADYVRKIMIRDDWMGTFQKVSSASEAEQLKNADKITDVTDELSAAIKSVRTQRKILDASIEDLKITFAHNRRVAQWAQKLGRSPGMQTELYSRFPLRLAAISPLATAVLGGMFCAGVALGVYRYGR